MKCPKCNYVSHDYLDACRKCGIDLVTFKQDIGLLVLQPGVLDLSLVLSGAGGDDLFESVEEGVTMHASDDDFDISLDDYTEHPSIRRAPAGAPRSGRPEPETDLAGMDHLTLELDASELPADVTARLRAAQVIADEPPATPTQPPAEPGATTLPGHVTLEIEPESISSDLPTAILQNIVPFEPPPPQNAPASLETQDVPSLQLDVSHVDLPHFTPADTPEAKSIDEAEAESVDEAVSVVDSSGTLTSFPLQDVVLAEDTPIASAAPEPDLVMPTLDEAPLTCADETIPHPPAVSAWTPTPVETPPEGLLTSADMLALENLEDLIPSEYLTLELDLPALPADSASSILEEAPQTPPPAPPATPEPLTSADPEPGLPLVEATSFEDLDDIALPGHLTLELDGSEMASEVSSIILDNLQLDDLLGNIPSQMPPRDEPADDEEELLLDLESLALDEDDPDTASDEPQGKA